MLLVANLSTFLKNFFLSLRRFSCKKTISAEQEYTVSNTKCHRLDHLSKVSTMPSYHTFPEAGQKSSCGFIITYYSVYMTSQCCALTFTAHESWSEHITLAQKKKKKAPLATSTKEPRSGFHFPCHADTNHPLNRHKTLKHT